MIILGIDPGFAHLGWAILLHDSETRFVAVGTVVTEKTTHKREVRAASDNTRRLRELSCALAEIVETKLAAFSLADVLLAAEEASHPRHASSAIKVGAAWGVVVGFAATADLPIVEVAPKDLKRIVTGRAAATKGGVQAALESRYPDLAALWPLGPRGGTDLVEHACDAAAVAHCALASDLTRAMRRQEKK